MIKAALSQPCSALWDVFASPTAAVEAQAAGGEACLSELKSSGGAGLRAGCGEAHYIWDSPERATHADTHIQRCIPTLPCWPPWTPLPAPPPSNAGTGEAGYDQREEGAWPAKTDRPI